MAEGGAECPSGVREDVEPTIESVPSSICPWERFRYLLILSQTQGCCCINCTWARSRQRLPSSATLGFPKGVNLLKKSSINAQLRHCLPHSSLPMRQTTYHKGQQYVTDALHTLNKEKVSVRALPSASRTCTPQHIPHLQGPRPGYPSRTASPSSCLRLNSQPELAHQRPNPSHAIVFVNHRHPAPAALT